MKPINRAMLLAAIVSACVIVSCDGATKKDNVSADTTHQIVTTKVQDTSTVVKTITVDTVSKTDHAPASAKRKQ